MPYFTFRWMHLLLLADFDKEGIMRSWELEDPEIGWIERTGYPSWLQERETEEDEEDYFTDD